MTEFLLAAAAAPVNPASASPDIGSAIDLRRLFEAGSGLGNRLWADTASAAVCAFVRIPADGATRFRVEALQGVELLPHGGWLLRAGDACYWIPAAPVERRYDQQGHIQSERPATTAATALDGQAASLTLRAPAHGAVLDLALWRLPPALADELRAPLALELQPAYLWGSHTRFGRAADLYLHLTHGVVYENRYAWPFKIRVASENDAHAIGVQLAGLQRAGGRAWAGLLSRQVLACVVDRLGPDGAFRHGVWTDGMESHYRLHCSGMHLMMDALAQGPDAQVEAALRRAAAFLAQQHERLAAGVWFLHDELELSVERMKQGPFRWVASRALGKSEANMLVLNTQLDASIALDRYRDITGDEKFAELVMSARQATQAVLGLRPAETLYRCIFWCIGLSFLPTPQASALPAWKRALKRLTWQTLIPRLPDIKARFPRLVMPGGYIDRELTLRTWAHDYHAINLMDLARYLRRFDDPVVRRVLVEGLAFTRRSGILQRWQELDYQKYALGFWAEALYHVCTLFPDAQYRQWLAEAMLVLEDLKIGQPPSLLGANAEAVPVAQQMPCPSPADAQLRVANLGRRRAPELLVVNATDTPLPLGWEIAPVETLAWQQADGNPAEPHALQVPARGWLWARTPH